MEGLPATFFLEPCGGAWSWLGLLPDFLVLCGHPYRPVPAGWLHPPPPPMPPSCRGLLQPHQAPDCSARACLSDTAGPALLMQGFGSGHSHSCTACPITYCSSRPRTLSSGIWGFPGVPRLVLCAGGWPLTGDTFGLVSPSYGGCRSCLDRLREGARVLEPGLALSPGSSSWA